MLVLLLGTMLTLSANPITKAEARQVAQEFIGIDDASSDDVPVAPYYVFSRGEGQGYVIVSGDDSTTPIIGYTEQGDFVEEKLPEQLRDMLASWANRIGQVQAKPQAQGPRRSVRERLLTARRGVEAFKESWVDVPVMCQTHWHQSAPYNNLAPVNPDNTSQRAVTGCVATAASQIIYYFHKDNPDTLIYDTPTYSYGYPVTESLPKGTPIEYDQMKAFNAKLLSMVGNYELSDDFDLDRTVSRDEAKKGVVSFLFSPRYFDEEKEPVRAAVKRVWEYRFPTLLRCLYSMKQNCHAALAYELQKVESTFIFDIVCPRITDELGCPYCTVHDSVIVPKEYCGRLKAIMDEELARVGIPTITEVEYYDMVEASMPCLADEGFFAEMARRGIKTVDTVQLVDESVVFDEE